MIKINTHRLEKNDLQEFFCLLTKRCNANCTFCIEKEIHTGGFLTFSNFKEAVSFAKINGLNNFYLHGGEPTLHPDIVKFAEYAKANGLKVKMFTNGLKYDIIKSLDGILDEIKISYRNEAVSLRFKQKEWKTKLKLGILVTEDEFPTEQYLLDFIKYAKNETGMEVYVNTMNPVNQGAYDNQFVSYLEDLFLSTPINDIFSSFHKASFYLSDGTRVRMGNKSLMPRHSKYSMSPDGEFHDHFEHDTASIKHDENLELLLAPGKARLENLK